MQRPQHQKLSERLESEAPTFADRYCAYYQCSPQEYEQHLLSRILMKRTKVLAWLLRTASPQLLHAERNVVRQSGYAYRQSDIQGVIEFYRHKFVSGDWYRETFGFRMSGKKLMLIAREVFEGTQQQTTVPEKRASGQRS
ncbi:MAG: hypothetical protein E1N59_2662 [Puniceicoccaceae bacterium 5H]|nr:MAG: hypothetical protein E1N59_2662 [Puniceicoccaceae bacterium 5H]